MQGLWPCERGDHHHREEVRPQVHPDGHHSCLLRHREPTHHDTCHLPGGQDRGSQANVDRLGAGGHGAGQSGLYTSSLHYRSDHDRGFLKIYSNRVFSDTIFTFSIQY